jgi:RNA-directed DNA polymerase
LTVPTVKDRVAQMAALLVLEPIFEADFLDSSYGFRPGKSAHQAVEQIRRHLAAGCCEVYDADLKGYFDTIPHDLLLKALAMRVADRQVLRLIRLWLEARIEETDERGRKTGHRSRQGTPQGGVITPQTILQTAPLGALVKRERIYPVYHTNLGFVYFYTLYQRADDFASC